MTGIYRALFFVFAVHVRGAVAFTPPGVFRRSSCHCHRHVLQQLCSAVEGAEVVPRDVIDEDTYRQIEEWVQQRAEARWRGDYQSADTFRDKLLNNPRLLPPGLSLQIQDIPRSQGGGSRWSLICDASNHVVRADGPTVIQIAHATLGLAVSSTQTRQDCSDDQEKLVDQAMRRLEGWSAIHERIQSGRSLFECFDSHPDHAPYWWAVEQELRGRKAADAAFWFAMAGVSKKELYSHLLTVGVKEMQRFGHRPSCRAKDLWAVVDRFAAAGVGPNGSSIRAVSSLISSKTDQLDVVSVDEVMTRWDLHSDSCALLVWKFSTRQRKQRDFLASAARHWQTQNPQISNRKLIQTAYDWKEMFLDPNRPLVIDIGCGMGLSLLGIASTANSDEEWHQWEHCNFLGVDLSALAIGYGRSVSKRWGCNDTLQFVMDTAENALGVVESSYPGPVNQILIQFPTPYRLLPADSSNGGYQGNTQLPIDADNGFMVSKNLLMQAASLLRGSHGTLLLQSNCEDVALHLYNTAVDQVGMAGVPSTNPRWTIPKQTTQRTETWLSQHSAPTDRAAGSCWWNSPILPHNCQTETEIACGLNGTPVHRCLLSAHGKDSKQS